MTVCSCLCCRLSFFFSSRRRHTRCALVTGVQTCALPISSILDATAASIVKACMKAAYDGLRIDGKEAAIVVHENTYGQGQNQRKVKEAEYFPMAFGLIQQVLRSEEHTSELQSLMRISYAVFCLKKNK